MRHSRNFWLVLAFCLSQLFCLTQKCHGQVSRQAIQLLNCEYEALSARLALIASAKHEIVISTFHVEPGASTNAILDALRSAARRGVKVRLLFDGLKMELSTCQIESLQNDGIVIREFHPTDSGGLLKLNRRLHSKVFVVDGNLMIFGSRNLRDKHFGLESENFIDFEVALQGDVANQAVNYFNWIWNSCHVGSAKGKEKGSVPSAFVCATPCSQEPFRFQPQFDALACSLHDRRIDKKNRHMQAQRIEWVNSARKSLMIESPYPAFSHASLKAIEAAARRGVHVQIFTNSNSASDLPITYAALQNVRRRLQRVGVEIHEYEGDGTNHAKMFLVDGQFAVVGSHNFDARGDYFNLEFCIKIDSVEFTQRLEARLEQRSLQSRSVKTAGLDRSQPLSDRVKIRGRQIGALLIRPLL